MTESYAEFERAMRRRERRIRAAVLAVGFFGSIFMWWLFRT